MQPYVLYAIALASATVQATPYPAPAGGSQVNADGKTFSLSITSGSLDDNDNKIPSKAKRDSPGKITSCGKNWVPLEDFHGPDNRFFIGYKSAVDAFCTSITSDVDGQPVTVGPKAYSGSTVSQDIAGDAVGLDQGQDPATNGVPGHIEFEIHNKQSQGSHTPDYNNCKTYLMKMTQANVTSGGCYGDDNDDTKGGTYLVKGSSKISYHALPNFN